MLIIDVVSLSCLWRAIACIYINGINCCNIKCIPLKVNIEITSYISLVSPSDVHFLFTVFILDIHYRPTRDKFSKVWKLRRRISIRWRWTNNGFIFIFLMYVELNK